MAFFFFSNSGEYSILAGGGSSRTAPTHSPPSSGIQTQTAECLVIGEITYPERLVVVLNKVDQRTRRVHPPTEEEGNH